ncbi:hypothetical protein LIER_10666 [Lithospermum erythrorhizon]|uniref:Reverse transcriptase Ty1/copia-type domain-containing protein n=1 Tax=Lithospermum erythrorhizon TaxID=34254 RepID=A0AAV3PPH3_LITER
MPENQGYNKTQVDHYVYKRNFKDGWFIILLLYVDDILLIGDDTAKINGLKSDLGRVFEMKDLGKAKHIFGKEVTLEAYTYADMARDTDSKRSTSGYLFTYAGGAVS